MTIHRLYCALLCFQASLLATATSNATGSGAPVARIRAPYFFEPNLGQAPDGVQFLARAGNFVLYLTPDGLAASGVGAGFRMRLVATNERLTWSAGVKLPGISNYFRGRNPRKWLRSVPNYQDIHSRLAGSGVNVIVSGATRQLEYQFRVPAKLDPSGIRLHFDQVIALRPDGSLSLRGPAGEFVHSAPVAFQELGGQRRSVAVRYALIDDHTAGFEVGEYDPSLDLVIDPVLQFYSFLGGSSLESATACAVDAKSALYLTGWTTSLEFQTAGTPFRDNHAGMRDVFVSKLHPSGSFFLYSTFIGGSQNEEATSISLDSTTNVFLTGTTYSADFPVRSGAFQQYYGGNGDAFLVKLNVEGSQLTYSSFAGGAGPDHGTGVASDPFGYATFVGYTESLDFPTHHANQAGLGGAEDMFLLKLHENAAEILFSTYFGSVGRERAHAVSLDRRGDIYITGQANCSVLPAAGSRLGALDGSDVIVIKWRASGASANYVTCIGGNGADAGLGIAVDRDGQAYVTGVTASTNFPIYLALQFSYGGALGGSLGDAFALKLNSSGDALLYSSYLGGARDDAGHSIVVDPSGSAFLAGATLSLDFPSASGVIPPSSGARSGFALRLSPQGVAIQESFFFEGIGADDRYAIALDERGAIYVVGGALSGFQTPSSRNAPVFPFRGPVQDVFLAKIATARLQVLPETHPATIAGDTEVALTQRLVNRGPEDADQVVYWGSVPSGATLVSCQVLRTACTVSGNTYRVELPNLPAGRGVEIQLRLRANPGLPSGSVLPVSASVQSVNHDPNLADNSLVTSLFTAPANATCGYSVSTQTLVLPSGSGSFPLDVITSAGCPWTVTASVDWVTVNSFLWMQGSGRVMVSFSENPLSAPRLGSMTIAGHRVVFLQQTATSLAPFRDVPASHPFADAIGLMRDLGITSGCDATNFCPDAVTTRGQMAVFIVRSILGGDNFSYPSTPYFNDVPSSHPQFRHIQKLRELGITNGCSASHYCPDEPVTRGQMALFLIRARLGIAAGQSFPVPPWPPFADVPPGSPAYEAVQKMREHGITSGCSATAFCPDQFTTRGQMAVFLTRALLTP